MKIEKISLYHIRMKLQAAFETSFGQIETRDCIIIEMNGEGLTGYGEVVADRDPGYAWETCGTAWVTLQDFLIPAMLKREIQNAADLQKRLSPIRGHQMAKAGLEMALWDLLGKAQNKSLSDLLGADRLKVEVGVSVGLQESPEKLLQVVEDYLSQGYRRVKLKIKPGRDVGDTSAVRSAFPDLRLQVDANSAYSLESAEALLPLDDLDLLLIEQPLAEDDLWDHHKLQKKFHTALCLDESITKPQHARQALEMGACRIVNIKPGRVGGISQGIEIHDLCQAQNVPVWCGGMLETGVGRAANLALAALPNFKFPGDISATERYYAEDITNEKFELNDDSTMNVPDLPGLGVTINEQALEKVTLRKIRIP